MDGENQAEALLEVIGESDYLHPDFFEVLLRDKPPFPWYNVPENRYPRPDIVKGAYRELVMEALYGKRAISAERLRGFREQLLRERLSYLGPDDLACASIASSSEDPALLRDKVRLCRECVEFYFDRKAEYEPGYNTLLEELRHIEILAGKIVHGFPGLGLSEKRDRNLLETLVALYEEGYNDVKSEFDLSPEEHAEKARRAREEIELLYGHSE